MKILYVENHSIFAQQVCQQFLSDHGVTVVPDLEGARAALKGERFDLLIVDYDLDDGKGDDLVRKYLWKDGVRCHSGRDQIGDKTLTITRELI